LLNHSPHGFLHLVPSLPGGGGGEHRLQERSELLEFLGADRSDADLLALASRLRIALSPPEPSHTRN